MNQGKLELVKQEMARVNIDILGISKLKWNVMGEFNINILPHSTQILIELKSQWHTIFPVPKQAPSKLF